MNDVEREVQDQGYKDGYNRTLSTKYATYQNLLAAYRRGWNLGQADRERDEKQQ